MVVHHAGKSTGEGTDLEEKQQVLVAA